MHARFIQKYIVRSSSRSQLCTKTVRVVLANCNHCNTNYSVRLCISILFYSLIAVSLNSYITTTTKSVLLQQLLHRNLNKRPNEQNINVLAVVKRQNKRVYTHTHTHICIPYTRIRKCGVGPSIAASLLRTDKEYFVHQMVL